MPQGRSRTSRSKPHGSAACSPAAFPRSGGCASVAAGRAEIGDHHLCLRCLRHAVRRERGRAECRGRTRAGGAGGCLAAAFRRLAGEAAAIHLAAGRHGGACRFLDRHAGRARLGDGGIGARRRGPARPASGALPRTGGLSGGARRAGRAEGAGRRVAILSNGSPAMLEAAVASAGVAGSLDAVLSVEEVGVFKPDARVYDLVGRAHGRGPRRGAVRLLERLGRGGGGAPTGSAPPGSTARASPSTGCPAAPTHVMGDLTGIPTWRRILMRFTAPDGTGLHITDEGPRDGCRCCAFGPDTERDGFRLCRAASQRRAADPDGLSRARPVGLGGSRDLPGRGRGGGCAGAAAIIWASRGWRCSAPRAGGSSPWCWPPRPRSG
jgi:hypothetical protein